MGWEFPMRILLNIILILCGFCGAAVAFLGNITVDSSLEIINGMQLSIVLGVFSVIVIINALVDIFSTN